jgi:hypothetical protein
LVLQTAKILVSVSRFLFIFFLTRGLGRLDRGESVSNDKGVLVTPEQVKDPDSPGPVCVLLVGGVDNVA